MYIKFFYNKLYKPIQRTKKVVSSTPGLVDFDIRLENSVLTELTGKWSFLGYSNYRRTIIKPAHQIFFFSGLVKMTYGWYTVHANDSLPKGQAVKLTFLAPCLSNILQRINLSIWYAKNIYSKPLPLVVNLRTFFLVHWTLELTKVSSLEVRELQFLLVQ